MIINADLTNDDDSLILLFELHIMNNEL